MTDDQPTTNDEANVDNPTDGSGTIVNGIHIDGWICREDDDVIDHDQVLDKFLEFCVDSGWTFGGSTKGVDMGTAAGHYPNTCPHCTDGTTAASPDRLPDEARLNSSQRGDVIRSIEWRAQVTPDIRAFGYAMAIAAEDHLWAYTSAEREQLENAFLDKSTEEQMAMSAWRDACAERDAALEQRDALVEALKKIQGSVGRMHSGPWNIAEAAIAAAYENQHPA